MDRKPLRMTIKVARHRSEIVQCQYLIAEIYNKYYNIVFSADIEDLDHKIEPYPHRYIMGLIDGALAACCGLYLSKTYVTRYGQVTDEDIVPLLGQAGVIEKYNGFHLHELTKLVVANEWKGKGLSRFFLACCHNRSFLRSEVEYPWLLTTCAKLSIFTHLHERIGIKTRVIKPFPYYRVHEDYRSVEDPMDSRLIIPELDIPKRWLNLVVPGAYEVEYFGA